VQHYVGANSLHSVDTLLRCLTPRLGFYALLKDHRKLSAPPTPMVIEKRSDDNARKEKDRVRRQESRAKVCPILVRRPLHRLMHVTPFGCAGSCNELARVRNAGPRGQKLQHLVV
jgi:hypothetical protein